MNIQNMLLAFAIGDAFGAGVEFQDRDWIRNEVDFTRFVQARHRIPVPKGVLHRFTDHYTAWDYTDDTEMTIGVIRALMAAEAFSEELLVQKWQEEYDRGKQQKGYGRNGHGSMAWYFSGEKSLADIQAFQRDRPNPGNAPAMRSVPLGLMPADQINSLAKINAAATHPNEQAIISSQCVARAAHYLMIRQGDPAQLFAYCRDTVELNPAYQSYLQQLDELGPYDQLQPADLAVLCGPQPIEEPYFLPGIKGVPSDSLFTTGSVLYILKHSSSPMDALKKSIYLGGDVDSIAAITTGILAAVQGLESLPAYMLEQVEGRLYVCELADTFAEWLDGQIGPSGGYTAE